MADPPPPQMLPPRVGDAGTAGGDSIALRAMKDITFGSIAGMVSKVFEHPFDLTKVRLQSQVLDATARFSGPLDCLNKTWRNEGVRGLYRGLPAPIVGAMAENASLFLAYGEFQTLIRKLSGEGGDTPVEKMPLSQLALAAAGAGAVTSFLLTPIELVKCKMQVQMLVAPPLSSVGSSGALLAPPLLRPQNLPGPISVLVSVVRNTGFRGLWLGHTGTFIRETGGTAAWFTTKEFIASLLVARRVKRERESYLPSISTLGAHQNPTGNGSSSGKRVKVELKPWESALSGACAGAAFNFALFPADTVKSAMQTEEELRPRATSGGLSNGSNGSGQQQRPASFFRTFKEMYGAKGLRGLYAGCGITVARSIPSSAIIFLIYDGLSKRFG